jgi:hypothetical protein
MASMTAMKIPWASSRAVFGPVASKRAFSSPAFQQPRASIASAEKAATRQLIPRSAVQQSFRRAYAAEASATQPPPLSQAPKKRRGGFFRWTWRAIYLSAFGGIGYLTWSMYQLRTPTEQFEADPSKKTLVILGLYMFVCLQLTRADVARYWLGLRFTSQEARHRELQRYSNIA